MYYSFSSFLLLLFIANFYFVDSSTFSIHEQHLVEMQDKVTSANGLNNEVEIYQVDENSEPTLISKLPVGTPQTFVGNSTANGFPYLFFRMDPTLGLGFTFLVKNNTNDTFKLTTLDKYKMVSYFNISKFDIYICELEYMIIQYICTTAPSCPVTIGFYPKNQPCLAQNYSNQPKMPVNMTTGINYSPRSKESELEFLNESSSTGTNETETSTTGIQPEGPGTTLGKSIIISGDSNKLFSVPLISLTLTFTSFLFSYLKEKFGVKSIKYVLENNIIPSKIYMEGYQQIYNCLSTNSISLDMLYQKITSTIRNYLYNVKSEQFFYKPKTINDDLYHSQQLFNTFFALWSAFKKSMRTINTIIAPIIRCNYFEGKQSFISSGYHLFKQIIIESTILESKGIDTNQNIDNKEMYLSILGEINNSH
ncbi:hypothetical protein PPL_00451 [Heterostelium album PN500]|uniref:Uncharacterized protein n=1 Tax=Heterostelium pallidum (strain ATCC 26659 / Pp 5 / PN500) TaxID=670386 RepID=D3AWH7_HETP5|nr:hypothetical protein PPL_00451 [Heterostelium album PN500]EFA86650.1 hypothetical protein PPL_00451 [Heterostelium album PN500]|eukprot:XP_020438755.1 hypothetical protein PPL_00451 [Heterostelium album PN500]